MIILKELRWNNAFSYGKGNRISFIENPLTQLVGRNGHGKSSIALILEEVLFNKNSKGIKKSDILNRYVKDKSYSVELDFAIDGTNYTIVTSRSSTQTVKLYRGEDDISSHTATGTYKIIEDLIGLDHKAFSQIVYQSSASSLEFLTATDTNRKKFLIDLLNLSKYSRAADIFKKRASDLSKDISAAEAKCDTINTWLNKYSKLDLTKQDILPEPEIDTSIAEEASALEVKLAVLESENKRITQNNTYKSIQSKIVITPVANVKKVDTDDIKEAITINTKVIKDAKAFTAKISGLAGQCPTCLQDIDTAMLEKLVAEQTSAISAAEDRLLIANEKLKLADQANKEYQKALTTQQEWEKYHALINTDLPDIVHDQEELSDRLSVLKQQISENTKKVQSLKAANAKAEANNAKIETITQQLAEFTAELEVAAGILHELSDRMGVLNVLTKTFSTTGLVAYKLECLVKDLEELTNAYLAELSDGRFQLSFQINASDKLNVIITDNGNDIDILALSGGERARVNASALLAIRKLMQSLSSSRINLLVLDETVEALDVDGKEKLIEVLLKEESLNTFLVSHGYNHPLLEKIHVVKEHNISRIEV